MDGSSTGAVCRGDFAGRGLLSMNLIGSTLAAGADAGWYAYCCRAGVGWVADIVAVGEWELGCGRSEFD